MTKSIWANIFALCFILSINGQETQPIDKADFIKKADAYVQALVNRTAFSGTILVAKGDDVILNKGYGLASRRFSIPNEVDTKFRIGSVTKSFTAILVLKQVEAGELSLDDTVDKYLPDYPFGDQIKIRHLLSHTSGIKRDIKFPNETDIWSMEELLEFSKVDSLLYEPGTQMSYSNCGYIILHYILEKITNRPYGELLQAEILSPLGMTETGIEVPNFPPKKLADGFRGGESPQGSYAQVEQNLISHGYSDAVGALYSTTTDLLTFCRQIRKPGLLKKETWEMATSPVDIETRGYKWGFGFSIRQGVNKYIINHNGRTTGFRCGYFYDTESDMTMIILANNADAERESFVINFFNIFDGRDYYQPKLIVPSSEQWDAEEYIGEYETEHFPFKILEQEGRLLVSSHGDPPSELVHISKDVFYCRNFDLNLTFIRENGKIKKCEWEYQGRPELAEKK